MALNLYSVNAKLDRAEQHFDAIDDEARGWLNGRFHSIVREANAEFTEHSLIYRCSREPDLRAFALMFGDGINALRNALDHLVFAIAVHESKKFPPPHFRSLAFPICRKTESFNKFLKNRLRGNLSTDVLTAIESVQPYNRTHPELLPLLYLLREFNDSDKHRLLPVAVTQAGEWQFHGLKGLSLGSGKWRVIPHDPVELKDNTKVATFVTDGPSPDLDYDRFGMKIVIAVMHEAGPNGATHTRLDDMIYLLSEEVRNVIDITVAKVK